MCIRVSIKCFFLFHMCSKLSKRLLLIINKSDIIGRLETVSTLVGGGGGVTFLSQFN